MPPSSSAAVGARRAARSGTGARPRKGADARALGPRASARARPLARVRWERLARVAMLCVLAALLYLYLSAGVQMFSTWRQERRDEAAVRTLSLEHGSLARQRARLESPETIELEARRLGMIRPGEQSYVVSGLPGG